jgi:hypothetical protein
VGDASRIAEGQSSRLRDPGGIRTAAGRYRHSTSGCVRASVVEAQEHGFHVAVVEECCFDRNLVSHKVNLFDMHQKYADVMHLDAVIEQINRLPRPTEAQAAQ